jgi:RES domain-containing protein
VKTLKAGSLVYRARQQKIGETLHRPYDFAPPPVERALRSNRMSPAGVVMFYGSDHPKTAQLEIDDDPKLGIVVGTFRTVREAHVLDLTLLPRRLGFFEQQSDSSDINRYALAFLHSFVESVAAKVEPGSREHIDYVPTQVVTEWFRTVFHFGKSSLDGIIYPSTQNPGGHSVVLFANGCDVFLTLTEIKEAAIAEKTEEWILRSEHEKAWLRLVRRRAMRIAT